jgi:ATP-binding cassette subfamily B protein RaxB
VFQLKRQKVPLVVQAEASECGLACVAMVAGYHGHSVSIAELREQGGGNDRGINLETLISLLERLNFNARPVKAELASLQLLSLPAILHWKFDHFVVLTNVEEGKITIHDPIGRAVEVPFGEVSKSFTGIAIELSPGNAFHAKQPTRTRLRISQLLGHFEGLRESLTSIFVLAFVAELLLLAGPLATQMIVDFAVSSRDNNILLISFLFLVSVVGLQALISLFRLQLSIVLRTNVSLALGSNLFAHLVQLPLSFFERRHLGDIVSRFDSLQAVRRAVTAGTMDGLLDSAFAVLTLIAMATYSALLTYVVLSAFGLYLITRSLLYRTYEETSREQIVVASRLQSSFLETLRGIQAIKLNNRESSRRLIWQNIAVEEANLSMVLQKFGALYAAAQSSIFGLENAIVLVVGASLVIADEMTIGMLFAFVAFKLQFTQRATRLVDHFLEFRMLSLHKERLSDVALEAPETIHSKTLSRKGHSDQPLSVELVDVSFRFSSSQPFVLRNVNLRVASGESVAIVGPSGCGKSTLLKIILGLLEPTEGTVLVNGFPVKEFGVSTLRGYAGVVMQNDVLFSGTITENISFFDLNVDDALVKSCSEQACILEDIQAMPMQFRTRVGDMGSSLSGGQVQRLLIARALYRKPRLLVFDEATSHLDIDTEAKLVRSIDCVRATRLLVAHRPESVGMAARCFRLG